MTEIMQPSLRIYLDNAATSYPKPPGVIEAVSRYMAEEGVPLGRAATRAGDDLARRIGQLRSRLATFFGALRDDAVVFTFSGTDSLNTVLHGALRPGDHVVTTDIEHNSVLRPLEWLRSRGIELTHVRCDGDGLVSPDDIREAVRPQTRLVAVSHASNVAGTIQPIADFAEIAHRAGARILVDACQTAGHLPIDVRRDGIDFLACSGHKGLRGPLGTGVLVMAAEAADTLESFRQGGTGTASESPLQPEAGAEKFEAGNHNVPGLIGLSAGLDWIEQKGVDQLREHEIELTGRLIERLERVEKIRIPGVRAEGRVGVVSAVVEGFDSRDVAAILDAEFGVEVRAGLHCAPRIHKALGTAASGGTVRISPGPWTTNEQIAAAADALAAIAGG